MAQQNSQKSHGPNGRSESFWQFGSDWNLRKGFNDFPAGSLLWFLGGAALGAIATYFLDPAQGRRRRALVRDKAVSMTHDTTSYGEKTMRHLKNKAKGMKARAEHLLTPEEGADDDTLVQRVRSEFGHEIRHAKAVEVRAENGRIILSGPVLRAELEDLMSCVSRVPGVRDVINHLEVHERAENVPGLQGEGKPYLQ